MVAKSRCVARFCDSCTGSVSCSVAFVERAFFLVWSRWPLVVASDAGKYFLMALTVIPGQDWKKPFFDCFDPG